MAAINKVLHQALLTIKENGNGRVLSAEENMFEADYDSINDMLADAQLLNHLGYVTRMNRKMNMMQVMFN